MKKRNVNFKLVHLNPANSYDTGWIKYGIDYSPSYVESLFRIADCDRIISLSFDVADSKGITKSLKKLRKLKDAILDFERMIMEMRE